MIRLEILELSKGILRVNFYEGSEHSHVLKSYRQISLESIQVYIDEIVRYIPGDYLRRGPNVSLLDKYKKKANLLFQAFFGEIASELTDKINSENPNQLLITMDENLVIIPFENFYTGTMFLWEGFIITRQIYTKEKNTREKSRNKPNFTKAVLFGNPTDDKSISESVQTELQTINDVLGQKLSVSGPHFGLSIDKLELIESLSNNNLFHFSGHFTVKNGKSGWLLEDTIFNQADVSDLMTVPEFIFSNSCGFHQEFCIGGFIREFLKKGVHSIITTTGLIPSREAAVFSQSFYQFLMAGKTIGNSVYLAKKKLVSKFGMSNLSWCFYVLFGNYRLQLTNQTKTVVPKFNIQKKSLVFGVMVTLMGLLVMFGVMRFHTDTMQIRTIPPGSEILINGRRVSKSPCELAIKSGDSLLITKNGHLDQKYTYGKMDHTWGLMPINMPNVIITEEHFYDVPRISIDSVNTVLSNSDSPSVVFESDDLEFSLVIDQHSTIFTGKSIYLQVNPQPHRYIIIIKKISYDQILTIRQDTIIQIQQVESDWHSGRFN